MAIMLVTGVPGAGKTLRGIFEALEKKAEGRPVFHIGIDGMKPDIIPESLYPIEEWKKLPAGSVLVVDEAHKYLPVRQPGRPPQWIQDITEIRHFGIELILITQDPRNIDSFVRRLVGVHKHLTRKAGLNGAMVRTFQGVSEDPNDYGNRQSSEQTPWKYPKHLFQVYKSASLHVVKPKIPFKVIIGLTILLAALIAIPFAVYKVKEKVTDQKEVASAGAPASVSSPASPKTSFASNQDEREDPWASAEAFAKAHDPLIPGVPWSAPIFAGKDPLTNPRIFCIASGEFGSRSRRCRCFTEQATRMDVPTKVCETAVVNGIYNPYHDSSGSTSSAGGARVDAPPAKPTVHTL